MKVHPDAVTMEWSTEERMGKVFLDHKMNAQAKTIASVYSPRASIHAGVSMPLEWDALGEIYPSDFNLINAPDRLREKGDLWSDILDSKADLRALMEAIASNPIP